MRRITNPLIALLTVVLVAAPAVAAELPNDPITMVVPWPRTGSADLVARLVADRMSADIGQSVSVVNRVGRNGALGTKYVLDERDDGLTLLVVTSGSLIFTPLQDPEVDFQFRDFDAIAQIAFEPIVVAASDGAPWQDLSELVDAAKQAPGTITYAAVTGGPAHVAFREWAREAGIELVHVPQPGEAYGLASALDEKIDLIVAALPALAKDIEDENLRGLVVFSRSRDVGAPDVPTARELGYNVEGGTFVGLALPRRVSRPRVQAFRDAVEMVIRDPDFNEQALAAGVNIAYLDDTEFEDVWRRDSDRFSGVLGVTRARSRGR